MVKNNNRKFNNRPVLSQSEIIDLKGRRVGTEDLQTAASMLRYAEHNGYRGSDLDVAGAIAGGLEVAIGLSLAGKHEQAAKQAGNCLWTLKKNRELTTKQNRRSLGSIEVPCRDGQTRMLGNIVEWFMGVHGRIPEQIAEAKAAEAEAIELAELAQLEAATVLTQAGKDALGEGLTEPELKVAV